MKMGLVTFKDVDEMMQHESNYHQKEWKRLKKEYRSIQDEIYDLLCDITEDTTVVENFYSYEDD